MIFRVFLYLWNMDWEILIPILMFAFPVVVALLDKRARQKRAATPPSRPAAGRVERSEVRTSGPAGPGTLAQTKLERALRPQGVTGGGAPFENGKLRSSPDQEQAEEGLRAINRKEEEKKVETQPADKLKIDKKKLIIYSEILKPKFDE